ncbi:MAG: HypC/HybG/HupF family hydrogenase formation chaperone [Lentisphaerae bacterium]|nr:HypC/HybG/HupF family hydrogenase formation chaperone [Lentisphaerota bacterium]
MCLAIPMKIISIRPDGCTGCAEYDGIERDVNLSLIDKPKLGEYVIIHAGFAIEKFNTDEAEKQLELFRELADAVAGKN